MLHGDIGLELGQRVAGALKAALDVEITPEQAIVRPSAPGRGADYQCNAAMSLGKQVGKSPRELAQLIVDHLDAADIVTTPEIAGPGFINFTLTESWLAAEARTLLSDDRLGVPATDDPGRYVIDYSSPNVAKEMHIGHVRTTVIGDCFVRLLEFAGHEVIRRNHLGDWGTPFGMLIEHLLDEGWTAESASSIADLDGFYKAARVKFDSEPEFAERARARVVKLQGGDEQTLTLWRGLVAESEKHFAEIYRLLGVKLTKEDSIGESFYNPFLADTVEELTAKGLTKISDGALCVFPPGFVNREKEPLPIIVRKSDGGATYGTTDLAGVRYWTQERKVTDLLYVVGLPQQQHFQMVFAVGEQAGWLDGDHRARYLGFGSILGSDGKMFRTRAGGTVKFIDVLTEAVDRAAEVVRGRAELDAQEQAEVARAVGIGAVKYADLSTDREKDYVFDWDKMLATEGNTSVYLQYANARILSVLRKAEREPGDEILVEQAAERALVLKLLQFPAALAGSVETYAPHKLCGYLYETATAFSSFYENCPILKADTEERQASRLALARLTSRTLVLGLSLLGIDAPTRL
ncbi:arginine--tRNA ligase [Pseudonocardiaceae bacterium YIM PH 21723]|nr:arginine--tRNA ligase [Pseudonocardiaceae bacterium YIM PH 21723]